MRKLIGTFGLAILLGAATPVASFAAASPLCLLGCVDADVHGLPEIADALKQWAQLLPGLNEQFHEKVQQDIKVMDAVATDLMDKLDRIYGKNLDLTDQAVRKLILEAQKQIDEIGNQALAKYKKALFETECTVSSITDIVADRISEGIPSFQWIRSLLGEKVNVLTATDLNGKQIEMIFDPESRTDRFQASYKLMTLKLNSAKPSTRVDLVLAIALDRQRLAYNYYCAVRASVGTLHRRAIVQMADDGPHAPRSIPGRA